MQLQGRKKTSFSEKVFYLQKQSHMSQKRLFRETRKTDFQEHVNTDPKAVFEGQFHPREP